ncbi:MAG TPA: hypothetical protein VMT34_18070 [Aggregatilineales bacterium]|nr:hypothetical protein [Aggregatilineales bacterium]
MNELNVHHGDGDESLKATIARLWTPVRRISLSSRMLPPPPLETRQCFADGITFGQLSCS